MNPLLLTLALLHGADITLTNYGISKQGGHEASPFLPKNQIGLTAVVTAESVGQIYFLHAVSKNHPKAAKVMSLIAIGAEGFIVYHNAKQLR
jgi:hypothetical protein